MTICQAAFWCADAEFIEKLGRWRMMTPAVRAKMRAIEGFTIV